MFGSLCLEDSSFRLHPHSTEGVLQLLSELLSGRENGALGRNDFLKAAPLKHAQILAGSSGVC